MADTRGTSAHLSVASVVLMPARADLGRREPESPRSCPLARRVLCPGQANVALMSVARD
jgi:hypothetical protein